MTRFGVMKHLRVLERCGRRRDAQVGQREAALPEPSAADPDDSHDRLDRQVHGASRIGAVGAQVRVGGKDMATESKTSIATTQVYEVYIKASPQAIWDAITSPEWTVKYGYQGAVEYELRPGGRVPGALDFRRCRRWAYRTSSLTAWSEEADPPRSWFTTYRFLFSPEHEGRGLHARPRGKSRRSQPAFSRLECDPRARGRADHGRHGGQQVLRDGTVAGPGSQRPEVGARDRGSM